MVINFHLWTANLLSWSQILPFSILFVSIVYVIWALYLLRLTREKRQHGNLEENFECENTQYLVTAGIYKYIRHPMYGSLLLLATGAFLKSLNLYSAILLIFVCIALYITVRKENIDFLERSTCII